MLDIVFIKSMEVDTIIGVYDWEKNIRQCLIIDLDMAWDIKQAAVNDDITKALDYAKVAEVVNIFAADSQFELVETFAERLAILLREQFAIAWLRLRITKLGAVSGTQGVGVEIERGSKTV